MIDDLLKAVGGDVAEGLAGQFGMDKEAAEGILPKVAPFVLGALSRQAKNSGPEGIGRLLDDHGDDSILDDIGGFFTKQSSAAQPESGELTQMLGNALGGGGALGSILSGSGLLDGLLGNVQQQVNGSLDKSFGLDQGLAAKILPALIPIILGFLTKSRNAAGGGQGGLESVMGFLDMDGDGSALDDLAEQFMGGGGLGGIINKVLG